VTSARLRVAGDAGDHGADDAEPVTVGVVAEVHVIHEQLAVGDGHGRDVPPDPAVESVESFRIGGGVRFVGRRPVRVGRGERVADVRHIRLDEDGVEPEVGVGLVSPGCSALTVARSVAGRFAGLRRPRRETPGGDDDAHLLAGVAERLLERPFQAGAVDDQKIAVRDHGEVARRRLERVQVGAPGDERGDGEAVTGDVLRDVGEEARRGDDLERAGARLAARVAACAAAAREGAGGAHRRQRDRDGERQGAPHLEPFSFHRPSGRAAGVRAPPSPCAAQSTHSPLSCRKCPVIR